MRRSIHRGFTLIELLVVVSIISLLAAVLFPAFLSAREGGRRSACLNNIKQLAVAETLYLQDNDETFWDTPEPGGAVVGPGCPSPACSGTTFWSDILMPYVKDPRVFSCPSNGDELFFTDNYVYPAIPRGTATDWHSARAYRVTYGFADFGPHADDQNPPWPLSKLNNPSQIALLTDAVFAWNFPSCQTDPQKAPGIGSYYFTHGINDPMGDFSLYGKLRHFNGVNFAYADGHAKFCGLSPATHASPPPWAAGYFAQARVNDDDCTNYNQ